MSEYLCTWAYVHVDNTDVVEYGNSIFFPFQIAFLNLIMPFHIYLSCASFIYWQYVVIQIQQTKDMMNYYTKVYFLSPICEKKDGAPWVPCT